MKSILIALPTMHKTMTSGTGVAVAKLTNALHSWGIASEVENIDSTELITARDYYANALLYSPHDAMLFVDSDMEFDPNLVARMIDTGADVVGAIYPMRKIDLGRFWEAARQQQGFRQCLASSLEFAGRFDWDDRNAPPAKITNGFATAAGVGMGLTLISKAALRSMIDAEVVKPRSDMSAGGATCYSFFGLIEDPVLNMVLSEDLSFCYRWNRQMGRELLACVDEDVTHIGPFSFTGRYIDLMTDSEPSGSEDALQP